MLPKYTIGLNETQLGIVAPTWFMATMKNTIPPRQAELALTLGKMFKTDEALKIGLVDEIADSKEEAIAKCEAFLSKYQKIPAMARAITKQNCRRTDIMELENKREADIELFATAIVDARIQSSLGKYVTLLKWKSRMKPLIAATKYLSGLFKPKRKK
jgi:3,2-trans-enoyl-CoA isomerase